MSAMLVCSNRPRPSVQRGCKGSQWWRKDAFHVSVEAGRTVCGRNSDDWLTLPARPADEFLADPHLCQKCATALSREPQS